MRIFSILKVIFKTHNLKVIDCNDYDNQPNFNKNFKKLIEGREVSLAFISNKINRILKKEKELEE